MLKKAVGPQIADLYGTMMRSTPVFFLQDDHDYFETDEADDTLVTMPPDAFMLNLARASQLLYYPEFLPDAHRGAGLPSGSAADRPAGVSESFGTLSYGRLLELLMYDCRRYMTMTGPSATFVPRIVEQWLKTRMARSDATHVVNMPSIPPGWSAGKWGEWYADMDGGNQQLTTKIPNPIGSRVGVCSTIGFSRRHPPCAAAFRSSSAATFTRSAKRESSRRPISIYALIPSSAFSGAARDGAAGLAVARPRSPRAATLRPGGRGRAARVGGKWLHHCRLHARARDAALLQLEARTA